MPHPTYINGSWKDVRNQMFAKAVEEVNIGKNVLIIDTLNCLNVHHIAFAKENQQEVFRKIFVVRIEKPYDLLYRIATAEKFIREKRIRTVFITSLTAPFSFATKDEVRPLITHLKRRIEWLTEKYNLTTFIGVSPFEEETAMLAHDALKQKSGEVK